MPTAQCDAASNCLDSERILRNAIWCAGLFILPQPHPVTREFRRPLGTVSRCLGLYNQKVSAAFTASSPARSPKYPHLCILTRSGPRFIYLFLFPHSWGSREAGRHAFRVLGLRHPHSAHPTSEQVRHSGAPPQAVEMEEEEEWEVQADLCWYVAICSQFYVNICTKKHMQVPRVA